MIPPEEARAGWLWCLSPAPKARVAVGLAEISNLFINVRCGL